jgi:hypothetical protein
VKFSIAAAVFVVILGTAASANARQDKGQDDHKQESRPAQQKSGPAPQQQRQDRPAAGKETQNARPAQQQHTQQASRGGQPQTHAVNRPEQGNAGHNQGNAPQTHAVNRSHQGNDGRNQAQVRQTRNAGGNSGGSSHGRISNAHYSASFGSSHRFHVSRGDYSSRRFQYGGYSFGFIDPWPVGWGYSDDVYVVYSNGGYYMYDQVHPGVRISINIL